MRYNHVCNKLPSGGQNLICWYEEEGQRKGKTVFVPGKLKRHEREGLFLSMEIELDRMRAEEAGLIVP